MHVHGSGKETMDGGNVLVSLFRERESHAVYLLEQQGVTRLDVLRYVAHGVTKVNTLPQRGVGRARTRRGRGVRGRRRRRRGRGARHRSARRRTPSTSSSARARAASIRSSAAPASSSA
jgi:ATP-dependent Clp protease ATP-binding subunit ClpA